MSGARGFLGWHTRCAAREQGAHIDAIPVGDGFDIDAAARAIDGSARAIHIAGINRATDADIRDGNVLFAEQFALALRRAENPPPVVVFANSTQSSTGSVYGEAKAIASRVLAEASAAIGAEYIDVVLPNLFGEHGRPFYNAVTSTFCHLLAQDEQPTVDNDKELTLLHAQNAADLLLGSISTLDQSEHEQQLTVSGLLNRLAGYATTYRRGEIPDIAEPFGRDLFNTYRSYTVAPGAAVGLTRHADSRGSFFEIIRSHGGPGQSSFSTTHPGVVRGDHFHRRKVERFTVLAGQGRISLRRLFTNEVVDFFVEGDQPRAVDMPTMWAHNITNVGKDVLYTSFWTNDIFDPVRPDTISEVV